MRIRSTRDAAAVVRGRRKELRLSQADLAARTGVSRKWIYEFEAGKPTAELGLVIRVLERLGLDLELVTATRTRAARRTVDLDAILKEHRGR